MRENYYQAVVDAYKKIPHFIEIELSKEDLSHVFNIATSILMQRDGLQNGGGFVNAIITNNLDEAIDRADRTCINALKFFSYIKRFVQPKNA